jgi:hypothetical protein
VGENLNIVNVNRDSVESVRFDLHTIWGGNPICQGVPYMNQCYGIIDTAVEAVRRLDTHTALRAIEGARRELDRYASENKVVFQASGESAVKQCADERLRLAFAAAAGREPELAIQLLREAREQAGTLSFWDLLSLN